VERAGCLQRRSTHRANCFSRKAKCRGPGVHNEIRYSRIARGRGACYYVRMATLTRNADAIAREHTERAVEVIAECMEVFDPRVALAAAQAMLDRGHGKPLTAVIQVPMIRRKQAALNAISTDDLLEAIEAEYEDIPMLPAPERAALRDPPEFYNPPPDPLLE